MKKDNKRTGCGHEELVEKIKELVDASSDQMDRNELRGFMDIMNQPKLAELNSDDRIGVKDVIIIGSYMSLNFLASYLEDENKSKNIKTHVITSDDIPNEISDQLIKIFEQIEKIKKKGNK